MEAAAGAEVGLCEVVGGGVVAQVVMVMPDSMPVIPSQTILTALRVRRVKAHQQAVDGGVMAEWEEVVEIEGEGIKEEEEVWRRIVSDGI
jgi:hypothetical protein